ncbi:MAG: ABC transporter ATP-binding protein [Ilumatobacteraceae bacterium]|jgi:spermidine/putrescine transport system ATP-binding protein|nr:ABC transporter ATP-binding protein [Ilumatobacteraceae bacterium]
MDTGDSVVQLDKVRKQYGSFVAVHEADFSIGRGEFFAMLGPSGCGKTTTLKMIAGFEEPTSGRILLEGEDVSDVPPHKRNVNTVFQQYALFPHMSVFDNVAFGPRSKKLNDTEVNRRVREMLDVVRLGDFASRRPAQLSGGQQQRVALARALVNYPSALLLDEPLAALDLKLREAMQIELKRIQREVGITFVFVTHDQGEALTMSDRIAVMSEGRVEQVGAPFDIYSRPESLFVAGFIGSANLLPGTIASTDGGSTRVDLAGGAQVVVPAGNSADNVSLSSGTRVTVMIRPEQLSLGGATGLSIDVTDTVFQGATLRLVGRMSNGTEVSAVLPVDPQRVTPVPGNAVTLSWHQSAPYLLDGWPDNAGSTTTNVDNVEAAL